MSNRALALLWLAAATWTGWWLMGNPLPDGYQNEYLHVGNAFDLWGAFLHGDSWHIRWYLFSNYWPEGMALFSFPFLWVEGFLFGTQSHEALVAGNLVHLGVMLWAVRSLGGPFRGALLAPVLLLLCPGVFGSLVRFEPNLADIAWTAAGLAFLLRSEGLRRRWDVIGFGAAVGIGLMLDRLTVAIFLIPALIPYLRGADRAAWRNLGLAAGTVLLFSGWYYWEFFHRHTEELLSQAPVGEIDSAGQVTAPRGLWSWVYYPLALLDSQAGPVVGALMLLGLASPRSRERDTLLWSVGGATALFTLIAKKQVFYTLPVLAPLAVLAARRPRLAWLGVAGGLWSFAALGLGVAPGGPWLPEALVSPRHTLARPPTHQTWPLDEAMASLAPLPKSILVLSEDETLYEGFVVLSARERWMWADVRGAVLDPQGTTELFGDIDRIVWVGPPGAAWPSREGVERELSDDHYDLTTTPPVAERLSEAAGAFVEIGRWRTGDRDVVSYRRVAVPVPEPEPEPEPEPG